MAANEKEDASFVYLASGKPEKAIQFFMRRRDYEDALLVASRKNAGVFTAVPGEGPRNIESNKGEDSNLREIVSQLAEDHFNVCEPILAAATHLALKDIKSAYIKLIRSHELSYALALATVFNLPAEDTKLYLARKAEKKGLWDVAMKFLENERKNKELLAAKLPDASKYEEYGLKRIENYQADAENALNNDDFKEAIRLLIVARNALRAAERTIYRFKALYNTDDLSEIFEILSYFHYSSVETLPVKLKAELLALGSLIGGIQSYWKGYSITYVMLGTYNNLLKIPNIDLPVGANIQIIINAIIESLRSPEAAKEILQSIQISNPRERESIEILIQNFVKPHIVGYKEFNRNRMKLVGGSLPPNNANKKILTSVFTRKAIQGTAFSFGGCNIGLDDAIMWAKVNPFSPLNDGSLINPY